MYVLDTDTYSNYVKDNKQIRKRLAQHPIEKIHLSVVTAEELYKGRLRSINEAREKNSSEISRAFDGLVELTRQMDFFRQQHRLLRYTEEAEALFQSWPSAIKRAGSQDCRIAAIACVNDFCVVPCNTRHFARIQDLTGVKVEDWSIAE